MRIVCAAFVCGTKFCSTRVMLGMFTVIGSAAVVVLAAFAVWRLLGGRGAGNDKKPLMTVCCHSPSGEAILRCAWS
jgi:hypothetical protein